MESIFHHRRRSPSIAWVAALLSNPSLHRPAGKAAQAGEFKRSWTIVRLYFLLGVLLYKRTGWSGLGLTFLSAEFFQYLSDLLDFKFLEDKWRAAS